MRTIAIIAAVAANGAIGFRGGIPWDSPEDRRIFADKTADGVLVCGRQTADTLKEAVLRNANERTLVSIGVGRFFEFYPEYDEFGSGYDEQGVYSLDAVAAHYPDRNIWICGGPRLYAEAMRHPLVTEMHLSLMDCEPEADTFMPWLNLTSIYGSGSIRCGGTEWRLLEIKEFQGGMHRVYRRI